MILHVDEFVDPQGRYRVHGATPDGASRLGPEDCDGVLVRYIDESVNPQVCGRLIERTGAFYYDAAGDLWEDEAWQEEGPGG